MANILAKKFNFFSLMRFTGPTIIMMVFMSLYTMVDGAFVSRFVGTSALSAINIMFPILSVITGIGIMLATGASAVIAKKMGEGNHKEAKEDFTVIVIAGLLIGVAITIIGLAFIKPMITALGATSEIFDYCYQYGVVLLLFAPLAIMQMLFQYFFVTAGKPHIGLAITVIGGLVNVVLDYVFIVPLNMGISGAAIATGIGFSIPGIFGLCYFYFNKKGTMHFIKPKMNPKVMLHSCLNGSSEMVTNLAMAVTTFLFNLIMMKYLGEDGVAAITIVLYSQYLLTAIYLGFSSGVAPVLSFNYGNQNTKELKKLFKISMLLITITSAIIYNASIFMSGGIVQLFAKEGSNVYAIAKNGFGLFSVSYLFIGLNIFASAMFTALSNGKVSAIISFVRTFVALVAAIVFLPMIMGVNGVWLAVPLAEFLTLILSLCYIIKLRKLYKYA